MRYNPHAVDRALRILRNVTTLDVVRDFLERHGLPRSASSWDEMIDERLRPYLANRQLTMDDLMDLLREAEEYGYQHVFLYKTSARIAARLIDEGRIKRALSRQGASDLWRRPLVIEDPANLSLVDVRIDSRRPGRALVVKAVETRVYKVFVGDDEHGDLITRTWRREQDRAINVAELHQDGWLELRIYSHRSSTKYESELNRLWSLIDPFLPQARFRPVSLSPLKNNLAHGRRRINGQVRRSQFAIRNVRGSTQEIGVGELEDDLFADQGAVAGIKAFMKHNKAFCEGSVLRFEPIDGQPAPSRMLFVRAIGLANEFAITSNCTRQDHRFVVSELRRLNK